MVTAGPSLTPSTETNGARRTDSPRPVRVEEPRRRLRVVHCLDGYGVGGTELNCVRTLEQLDRDRFELSLVSLAEDGPLKSRFEAAGVPIHSFPVPSFYGPTAMRQAARLVALFRRTRPDVVHCHDSYTNVFAVACARAAGVPLVIASRRWWIVQSRIYGMANRASYRLGAHRVLANSDAVARLVHETEGVRDDRIVTIPNFLEDEAFQEMPAGERRALLDELGVPPDAFVVGCVARLRSEKDLPSLLRAASALRERVPSLHVVLVGGGPDEGALRELARELGLDDRVHFAGFRPNRPNPHALFDVSVLCSLREGFPNTVIEAMAVARPVVATNVGGIPDVVEHGRVGLLVPPTDPAGLAAALESLASDPARRRRMGEAGFESVRARYTAGAVLGRLADLYETARGTARAH